MTSAATPSASDHAPPGERATAELTIRVAAARDAVLAEKLFQPQVAIVLGSGLGELSKRVEHAFTLPYADIPGFPKTHAVGHAGRLILGYLAGVPVVMMQGRSHRYEGFSRRDVEFPVHLMHALGARTLVTTNAAGGLNPRFRQGELMVIDSHIDFLWPLAGRTLNAVPGATPGTSQALASVAPTGLLARGPNPYDLPLVDRVRAIARRQDTVLHQGCYLATLGPTYETRSEYRMFRTIGADAVGMSTVPEVLAARVHGMRVLGFSVITNVASTDLPQSTTHEEVVDSGNEAGPRLIEIVATLLEDFAGCPD